MGYLRTFLFCCAALLMASQITSQQRTVSTFVLGSSVSAWRDGGGGTDPLQVIGTRSRPKIDTTNTPGNAVDFSFRPGWIGPLHFDPEENIASRVLEEGASITAPNALEDTRKVTRRLLAGTVNGDHLAAFERKPTELSPRTPLGIWIILDFNRPLGVHRVRFYPRNTVAHTPGRPYQADFLRAFELWVNPTQTSLQRAPDQLVQRRATNEDAVVDISVPVQYLRLVKLKSLSEIPWEIDEIEVYADGFLQAATYQSDLLDLGDRATLGKVRWLESVTGRDIRSQVSVRVRTGSDATPLVYHRRLLDSLGVFQGETEIIDGSEFVTLGWREQDSIEPDVDNWSQWKTVVNGGLITAPGQRRYIQFQLDFRGALFDTRHVNWLSFDYLTPPLGDALVAEVYPRLVQAEERATFRYGVRLTAEGPVRGYDRLEVDTNAPIEHVRNMSIDGHPVAFTVERADRNILELSFPLVRRNGSVLEFTFDVPVFRFGTTFTGRAYNSRIPDLPQRLEAGDVDSFGPDDLPELSGLSVAIPRAQVGKLVGEIVVTHPVATPNGDGINDEFELFFNLLQLTRPRPVTLEIHDLNGQRLCTAVRAERGIGPAFFRWDGRLHSGRLVPPGTYLWLLRIDADAFEEKHTGTMAVVY